jgi:hypothetical protein
MMYKSVLVNTYYYKAIIVIKKFGGEVLLQY